VGEIEEIWIKRKEKSRDRKKSTRIEKMVQRRQKNWGKRRDKKKKRNK